MFGGLSCLDARNVGIWTRNLEYQAEESRANLGTREPQSVCERERAMARALCMGRVGVRGAGLSSGAADLGDVLWGTLL